MPELVEDGDADLPLELVRVGERLDERPAEDRDLVGHVLVALPEPEEVGVAGILFLDDDGDVLERPGDARRQRVERPADVLLELPLVVMSPTMPDLEVSLWIGVAVKRLDNH